jgi:hypothetical protein
MSKNQKGLDENVRVKGDTVIHTPRGGIFQGSSGDDRPRGLTDEQYNEQLYGTKQDEREVREASHGERQSTPNGDLSERQAIPGEGRKGSDDLADPPFGKRPPQE